MHPQTILSVALLVSATVASPLFARTHITSSGNLRPSELVTRNLEVRNTIEHLNDVERRQLLGGLLEGDTDDQSSSDTGSTSSSAGGGGAASSGESASGETAASSSSSCQFLGGCSAASGTACPVSGDVENVNTSSSLCGSSSSTSSSGFLSGSRSRLLKRIGAALSFSKA